MNKLIERLRTDPKQNLEMRLSLARKSFIDYCRLLYPAHYTKERKYLTEICNNIQNFMSQSEKHFLVINLPPRHYKSFTATCLVEWIFGQNPELAVMTGSYNEILSTSFARKVRDTINQRKVDSRIVYTDIFPETRIKQGQASASLWALNGSSKNNYLATSPTGTATGFGANIVLIDDIIKNAEEAYNEMTLEKHWSWFTNTMIQRLEGQDWKVIVIMTRWALGDLAGRIIEAYPNDAVVITKKAVQDNGAMLCPNILSKRDYDLKTREMNNDIVEANYNQKPIDVGGRLYQSFKEWELLPENASKIINFTDTADTGSDFLCSVNGAIYENEFYITDLVFTDEPMETTEKQVAELLMSGEVSEARIESNNGGRGFARNVERLLIEKYQSNKTDIRAIPQTHNKESRILASSAWVANHIYMPQNWRIRFPDFYRQVMNYQKKGKNEHDDAVDVLASIYEYVSEPREVELIDKSVLTSSPRNRHRNYWKGI